jgi:hypothetical protein
MQYLVARARGDLNDCQAEKTFFEARLFQDHLFQDRQVWHDKELQPAVFPPSGERLKSAVFHPIVI